MAIHRSARKQSNFTIIDNVVFSSGLSFRAMGLLSYLLSKPDHWSVSVTQLVSSVADSGKADGRDAVYAMLKELIKAGFVQRNTVRDESGKMMGSDYIVFDQPVTPTDEPLTDKPHTGEPLAAEPTLVSTEGLGSTETAKSTDKTLVPSSDVTAVFDHWQTVMKKSKRTVLDANRKRLITKALKNYSVFDVKAAITGCALSPYHMGENESRKRYDGLELILRNAEKIEQFAGFAERPPVAKQQARKPVYHDLPRDFDNGMQQRQDGEYTL